MLVMPERLANKVLPDYYGTISDATTTIFIVMMLVTSMLHSSFGNPIPRNGIP